MTVTAASLRVDYPEFAAAPDPQLNYWLAIAGMLLNKARWGQPGPKTVSPPTSMYDVAVELFAAHNTTLEMRALAEAQKGAPPGGATGPISARSVGPLSLSYDTQAAIELDAGHWNLTIYGTRFIRLARMFGAGPIQVGPCAIQPMMSLVPQGTPWWGPSVDQGSGPD